MLLQVIKKISEQFRKMAVLNKVHKQRLQHRASHITIHLYISSSSRFSQVRLAATYAGMYGCGTVLGAAILVCVLCLPTSF